MTHRDRSEYKTRSCVKAVCKSVTMPGMTGHARRNTHAQLVNSMLDAATSTLNARDIPVIHSDRGGHYRWPGWLQRIKASGLVRSMSRKGCSPDNAACEGFFGRLKNEMYYCRNWANTTIEEFMQEVDSYIRWYNERRIKLSLGALSTMEYRQHLGLTV